MRACTLGVAMVLLATLRLTAATATPFQLAGQGGVIVPVTVNGAGPFLMLLDTGASHSAITEEVSASAGAPAVAKAVVVSPVGETVRAIVSVDRLRLGPIDAGPALPSVAPPGAFGAGVHGLIGQDVLAALRYTLDFTRREVQWHDTAPDRTGVRLRLAFADGRFLVALPQRSTTLRLVPDSGAGALVLFDTPATDSNIAEVGDRVGLRTAETRMDARWVRLREFRVGERRLRDVAAVALERPDRRPEEGDGLLPLHLFDRVTFDGPARVLILG